MLKIQQENSVKMIHFSFSFGEAFLPGLTNTSQMDGGKCNIDMNFPTLDNPRSIGRKAGISK